MLNLFSEIQKENVLVKKLLGLENDTFYVYSENN